MICLRCPRCGSDLGSASGSAIACPNCSASFPVLDGVPSFLVDTDVSDVRKFFLEVAAQHRPGASYVPFQAPAFDFQLRRLAHAFDRSLARWVAPGSTLLDVGCGHGALLASAIGRYRATGLDFVRESLSVARERGYSVVHGDAAALPFANAQFDAVVCAEVLQQFADPRPIVRELLRVCRPGGAVMISTLNKHSVVRTVARLLSRQKYSVPTIRRTVREVERLAKDVPCETREVAWVLSPTGAVSYSKVSRSLVDPFATNFILCLSATTS